MRPDDIIQRKEVLSIIHDAALESIQDIMYVLELYKFVTRDDLIARVNLIAGKNLCNVEPFEFDVEFCEIEKKFNIRIKRTGKNTIEVYYPAFRNINQTEIELSFPKYTIECIEVTPFNLNEIQDPSMKWIKYDRNILFKRILLEAIDNHATDLHFCVEHPTIEHAIYPVKYRANNLMYPIKLFELDESLNRSIISGLIENQTSSNSLDIVTPSGVTATANDPLNNGELELRIAANKVVDGCHCVIRIQKKESFNFTIKSLGFDSDVQQALYRMTRKRAGIVFITGAVRTGKNTTAFALANEMVHAPIKIVSYEYPVEVLMPFTQVDYHDDVNTLLNAVRLAKKQDINVAFINELPNKEVAFAVQDLVNSSIYVITTMHVNRVWHLPYKLKEYYGSEYKNIISQMQGIFNQKMFRVPCKCCQDEILVDSVSQNTYKDFLTHYGVQRLFVSHGCSKCDNSGFMPGKIQPYVEFIEFTDDLKSELLRCTEPFEMEAILKNYVMSRHCSLDFSVSKAISDGNLDLSAIDLLL